MKIKQISCDKVSVYLTNEDLELFDISPESLGPQSSDLHQFLFMLMETIKFETGFDPYNGQVIVEAKMTANGLHLMISRLSGEVHKITREEFNRARSVRAMKSLTPLEIGSRKNSKPKKKSTKSVFVFEKFNDLESAILLIDDGEIENCELYREGNRYALVSGITKNNKAHVILNEFAAVYKMSDILAEDIREGWRSVAKHDELAQMVHELRKMR